MSTVSVRKENTETSGSAIAGPMLSCARFIEQPVEENLHEEKNTYVYKKQGRSIDRFVSAVTVKKKANVYEDIFARTL